MKTVVSVSLGSSKRDHTVEAEFNGEKFLVKRVGTDGNMEKAIEMIKKLDGTVGAFGLGGIDLYLYAGDTRYTLRDGKKLASAASITPIVDGSGLKNTLERRVVEKLAGQGILTKDSKVLLVCGVDRFGMAQALKKVGCEMVFGDLLFSLQIPVLLRSLRTLERIAKVLIPVISLLPFKYIYPIGESQNEIVKKYESYYQWADVIAGDFHFIRRYLPDKLNGKVILTNTVTKADVDLLRQRGVKTLICTTPELNGRSFGTNVVEAIFITLLGKKPEQVTQEDYFDLMEKLDLQPRVQSLAEEVQMVG